jgi:hypothetical protein
MLQPIEKPYLLFAFKKLTSIVHLCKLVISFKLFTQFRLLFVAQLAVIELLLKQRMIMILIHFILLGIEVEFVCQICIICGILAVRLGMACLQILVCIRRLVFLEDKDVLSVLFLFSVILLVIDLHEIIIWGMGVQTRMVLSVFVLFKRFDYQLFVSFLCFFEAWQ